MSTVSRRAKRSSPSGWGHFAVALLIMVCGGGCDRSKNQQLELVSDTAERGPLRLVVTASPKTVLLGDPISISVSMHTPADYVVQFPTVAALGEMTARSGDARSARPAADGGLDWAQAYTVETLTSGTLELPPIVVKYAQKPPEPGKPPEFDAELASGTLKIEVRSALTSQDSVDRPRDITGTLLPAWRLTPVQWALVGAVVVAAGVLGYWAYAAVRRRMNRPPTPILPEVWALRALRELDAGVWFEKGRVRDFYYRLSEIVRTYIEQKFGLAAPEMTTEEFLVMLARDRQALPYDATRLRAFLDACDVVKYAAFSPRREDAEQAVETARGFVNATAAAAAAATARTAGGQAA